ncbi:MAG: hypothetical protein ACOYXB_00575 [Bacteroidota bacterium]
MARFSKYNSSFPVLAEGLAREGFTDKQIAARLGISESTLYEYQKAHPEFSEAIKRGKAPVDFEVENALLKRALGYSFTETHTTTRVAKEKEEVTEKKIVTREVAPDVVAAIFWLKNRRPDKWRDKQEISINYEDLSDDQLDHIIEGILKKTLKDGNQ